MENKEEFVARKSRELGHQVTFDGIMWDLATKLKHMDMPKGQQRYMDLSDAQDAVTWADEIAKNYNMHHPVSAMYSYIEANAKRHGLIYPAVKESARNIAAETQKEFLKAEAEEAGRPVFMDDLMQDLATKLKHMDRNPKDRNYMSLTDTQKAMRWADQVMEHCMHHPRASMQAYIKMNADHHRLSYQIPEGYEGVYEELTKSSRGLLGALGKFFGASAVAGAALNLAASTTEPPLSHDFADAHRLPTGNVVAEARVNSAPAPLV